MTASRGPRPPSYAVEWARDRDWWYVAVGARLAPTIAACVEGAAGTALLCEWGITGRSCGQKGLCPRCRAAEGRRRARQVEAWVDREGGGRFLFFTGTLPPGDAQRARLHATWERFRKRVRRRYAGARFCAVTESRVDGTHCHVHAIWRLPVAWTPFGWWLREWRAAAGVPVAVSWCEWTRAGSDGARYVAKYLGKDFAGASGVQLTPEEYAAARNRERHQRRVWASPGLPAAQPLLGRRLGRWEAARRWRGYVAQATPGHAPQAPGPAAGEGGQPLGE